ncbi:hypothetical protein [Isoptericola croceus]|uniref:hypothetical protein n=1 Tax=Isoptericola croceus TaxID=3031406 RepID=UPI0023F9EAE6|nr:hypothetical protein [Isoptericola croceus]
MPGRSVDGGRRDVGEDGAGAAGGPHGTSESCRFVALVRFNDAHRGADGAID